MQTYYSNSRNNRENKAAFSSLKNVLYSVSSIFSCIAISVGIFIKETVMKRDDDIIEDRFK